MVSVPTHWQKNSEKLVNSGFSSFLSTHFHQLYSLKIYTKPIKSGPHQPRESASARFIRAVEQVEAGGCEWWVTDVMIRWCWYCHFRFGKVIFNSYRSRFMPWLYNKSYRVHTTLDQLSLSGPSLHCPPLVSQLGVTGRTVAALRGRILPSRTAFNVGLGNV